MLSNIFKLLLILWRGSHYDTDSYRLTRMDPILCCCGCNKYVRCPWFEWFGCLYFAHCAWEGVSGDEAREENLCMCYTACNVICAFIVSVLHVSIKRNFSSDSHASVKCKLSCIVLSKVYGRVLSCKLHS